MSLGAGREFKNKLLGVFCFGWISLLKNGGNNGSQRHPGVRERDAERLCAAAKLKKANEKKRAYDMIMFLIKCHCLFHAVHGLGKLINSV